MPHSVLRKIIGDTSNVIKLAVVRYTTEQLRDRIRLLRPGGWKGAVYVGMADNSQVWSHLCGPEHGFTRWQVNDLTQDEALILHDLAPRHGNKIFPTYQQK